jgi:predicted transcriptional regulator of viral defense system
MISDASVYIRIMNTQNAPARLRTLPPGIVRTRDLTALGLTRTQVRRLAMRGELVRLARGLYCTPGTPVDARHTLAEVARRAPRGVVCLTSALQFHNVTTQNPRQVCLLLPPGYRAPRMESPSIWTFRAAGDALTAGVETHVIEGVEVRVTCVAKTVADCFKYRSRIGLDVALEALRECLRERRASVADLLRYARVCRVERVMRPYVEGMLEVLAA